MFFWNSMFSMLFWGLMWRNFLLVCSLYFGRHMRMLSIRLWIICVRSAYEYKLYVYAEHMHTIRKRMLSIHVWSIWFWCVFITRMLSIRIQFICVCWAYAYNSSAYAQCMCTNCMRMLSLRVFSKMLNSEEIKESLIKSFCTRNILPIYHWMVVKHQGPKSHAWAPLKVHKHENFFGFDFWFLSKLYSPWKKWSFLQKKFFDLTNI